MARMMGINRDREIQFTKTPPVLRAMLLEGLHKSETARQELRKKGLLG